MTALERWMIGIVLFVFAEWGVYHMGAVSQAKADQIKLDSVSADKAAAVDANKAGVAATQTLQKALAECTARIASNQQAADTAIMQQKITTQATQAAYMSASTQLTSLLAGECKAWAALPACTVDLPPTPPVRSKGK